MCLWTHVGKKRTFDCSMRREVGNFRLGCSIHLSYKKSASPRLSRSFPSKQNNNSHCSHYAMVEYPGSSSYILYNFVRQLKYHPGLKNFPKMDRTKLSASLSSLRCLTDSGTAGTAGQTGNGLSVPHQQSFKKDSRSLDFLNKPKGSWL